MNVQDQLAVSNEIVSRLPIDVKVRLDTGTSRQKLMQDICPPFIERPHEENVNRLIGGCNARQIFYVTDAAFCCVDTESREFGNIPCTVIPDGVVLEEYKVIFGQPRRLGRDLLQIEQNQPT